MDLMQLDQVDVKPQLIATANIVDNSVSTGNLDSDSQKPAEIDILPVVYEIIRSVEKDPVDNAAKQKESQDCSQKVLELQRRLESARRTIRLLPGIEHSKEEQLRRLESLRKQLALKQQLIKKYKNVQF
ncbi:mediator of RNA polymerase II transcription subunit 9 [Topomyia yanbarensis]|uniref:mediator of RNA polymerase II transcription subunit 9 n=1 Tax=Topomyia yanbarensis TaxID=2498891 RepID=UPI00273CAB9E|nr:mediator of RNA polymerase II transcription subunit 9 [Topomyia yanbarensis]